MAVVDMSLIVASRCLRGLEDTVMPMMISGVGSWLVAFPLGAILAFGFDLGPAGLWWGLTGGGGGNFGVDALALAVDLQLAAGYLRDDTLLSPSRDLL